MVKEILILKYKIIFIAIQSRYSIANKPNIIEKFCKCARTTDTLLEPNKIQLSESCLIFGKNITSVSYAIPQAENSGRWTNVQPLGPFKVKADYWVLDVAEDYQWSIIGQPSRKGFWIMSRNQYIDEDLYQDLLEKGRNWGFDLSDVERHNLTECQH